MAESPLGASPGREVPLFPLHTVLFPGGWLPLHIFEQRYRQMLVRCLQTVEREFVVALIKEGDEVVERLQSDLPRGTAAVPYTVGTVAHIAEASPLPDGRSFVLCHGRERVRIRQIVQQQPYLVAAVEPWPDPDAGAALPALLERAGQVRRAAGRLLAALEAALPEAAAGQRAQLREVAGWLPAGATDLSHFVARLLERASAEERQALLEAPSAQRRLELELPLLLREQQLAEQLRDLGRTEPPSSSQGPFGPIGRLSLN